MFLAGVLSALVVARATTVDTIRWLAAQGSEARCDLPRVDARGLSWSDFKKRGLRGSRGVILTGLFGKDDVSRWHRDRVLATHGNETFHADNTRGTYSFPKLADYIEQQNPDKMIFVSDSMLGLFGEALHFSVKPPRRSLLRDFMERPIFSVGVEGGMVPKHDSHPETWHALLHGSKAWWLGRAADSVNFGAWEDPCGQLSHLLLERRGQALPGNAQFCVQGAGEVLYFGDNVDHAACSLEPFVLGVGAQGHTENWPQLVRAANRGDLVATKRAVKAGGLALHETAGSYGHTALHRAALHGHAAVAKHLVNLQADPSARDAEGLTSSFLASFSGHVPVIEHLIGLGLGVDEKDLKGAGVLQWASTQGHLPIVELLVSKHGADVRAHDSSGGGSISAAATMGHAAIVEYLRLRGAEVEEVDADGFRPLHWAALHGHQEVVNQLLKGRARAEIRSRDGRRPLDLALVRGHAQVAGLLQVDRAAGKRPQRQKRRNGSHEL